MDELAVKSVPRGTLSESTFYFLLCWLRIKTTKPPIGGQSEKEQGRKLVLRPEK